MGATLMDGKALAERIRGQVAGEVRGFGRPIGLATVLVGDDPASATYVASKQSACAEVGIEAFDHKLPVATTEEDLVDLLGELNANPRVTGVLVQLPLPPHVDEERIVGGIAPVKDVDGFHPVNSGCLLRGRPTLPPATPAGVMELLRAYDVALEGARAAVIGRSNIVGKPLSLLLLAAHATVTVCHTRTRDLAAVVREADVVVAAAGRPETVTASMLKPGATVVDVGINRVDGRLAGDVAEDARSVAGLLTPVPGGVGPMTIAMLLANTVRAARYQSGELVFPPG